MHRIYGHIDIQDGAYNKIFFFFFNVVNVYIKRIFFSFKNAVGND